jgi:hypothetical protein
LIRDGRAPRSEAGKLGQAVTADLIWKGTISSLAYNKYSRQLKTSDRELVSYSGGWSVNEKLINVATRQIMVADSLSGVAPETSATTMSTGINSNKVLADMQSELVSKIVSSIVSRTFPITVISIEGNSVVLSQGGKSLYAGSRYLMVSLGKELKDPQTGESLGRVEADCCEVVIDKVSEKLSYGHLENVKVSLDNLPSGGLQVRQKVDNQIDHSDSDNLHTGEVVKKSINTKSDVDDSTDSSPSVEEDGKW